MSFSGTTEHFLGEKPEQQLLKRSSVLYVLSFETFTTTSNSYFKVTPSFDAEYIRTHIPTHLSELAKYSVTRCEASCGLSTTAFIWSFILLLYGRHFYSSIPKTQSRNHARCAFWGVTIRCKVSQIFYHLNLPRFVHKLTQFAKMACKSATMSTFNRKSLRSVRFVIGSKKLDILHMRTIKI